MDNITFSKLAFKILKIKYEDIEETGFKGALRLYLNDYLSKYLSQPEADNSFNDEFTKADCMKGILADLLRDVTFIPDGYRIIKEENEIHIYEIEDTHPLTINKLNQLALSWLGFDEVGIKLRCFVVDRYAKDIKELDLDLYEELLYGRSIP